MRRFWKAAELSQCAAGYSLALDGRPVKTPKANLLVLPNLALAQTVQQEWQAVPDAADVNPAAMPMTGFANATTDHVLPDPSQFIGAIAAYGESDAFCYRAEAGTPLAERQKEIWDPWLNWAAKHYRVEFVVVEGVLHKAQPTATLEKLRDAVAFQDAYKLAPLAKIAHLTGSLVAMLALVEGAGDAEELWTASCLDELWQEELWGSDHWAEKHRADRRADYMGAVRFLELLRL